MGFIERLDNIIFSKEKGVKPFSLTPSSLGAETQNRTGDTRIFSPLLYRLSYLGNPIFGIGEGTAFLLPKRNYNALGSVVKCFFGLSQRNHASSTIRPALRRVRGCPESYVVQGAIRI